VRYLLDTCVISEVTKKRPSAKVLTWLDAQDELTLFLSVITLGELQKGVSKLPAVDACNNGLSRSLRAALLAGFWLWIWR
jgi:predicted nucleic acid-binding protein